MPCALFDIEFKGEIRSWGLSKWLVFKVKSPSGAQDVAVMDAKLECYSTCLISFPLYTGCEYLHRPHWIRCVKMEIYQGITSYRLAQYANQFILCLFNSTKPHTQTNTPVVFFMFFLLFIISPAINFLKETSLSEHTNQCPSVATVRPVWELQ